LSKINWFIILFVISTRDNRSILDFNLIIIFLLIIVFTCFSIIVFSYFLLILFATFCLYTKVTNNITKSTIAIFAKTINNRLQVKVSIKEFNIDIFAKEFNINVSTKKFNIDVFAKKFDTKEFAIVCCYYSCQNLL